MSGSPSRCERSFCNSRTARSPSALYPRGAGGAAQNSERQKTNLLAAGADVARTPDEMSVYFATTCKSLKNMFPKQKVSLFEGEKLLDEDQIREEVK